MPCLINILVVHNINRETLFSNNGNVKEIKSNINEFE